jgi:uncharacterized protein YggT (Ycf19 family)
MIIRTLLDVYIYVLIFDAIFSFFPDLMKHNWRRQHKRICDFTCNPIRKRLPMHLPFDFSPILVILLINLIIFLW